MLSTFFRHAAYTLASLGVGLFAASAVHAATVPVWGQAYSPNVGWVNFYCNPENGSSLPRGALTGSGTIQGCAAGHGWNGVTYNTETGRLAGHAYSPNYGWLDVRTIQIANGALGGSTNFGNFGTTSFGAGQPNAQNPGVTFNAVSGRFGGYAYSTEAGYLSFFRDNANPTGWYGNVNYGVYTDIMPPQLITPPQVFAADDTKQITLSFDDANEIKSARVTVTGAFGNPIATYTTTLNPATGSLTFTHNFSEAKKYTLTWEACDAFDNCDSGTEIDFFHVVAAAPAGAIDDFFIFGSPVRVADGKDRHFVELRLFDRFNNPVVTEPGIKEVRVRFNFHNTTKLDQIAGTGDSARFEAASSDFVQRFARDGGTQTPVLAGTPTAGGGYRIYVASYAPTSAGFEPIAGAGLDLDFESATYAVEPHPDYGNIVGGVGSTTRRSNSPERIFTFSPTQTISLAAMAGTSNGTFEPREDAWQDIALGNPKRFLGSLQNHSQHGIETRDNEVGIVMAPTVDTIRWQDARIERNHGSVDNTAIAIDNRLPFGQAWQVLTGNISSTPASGTRFFLFRALPEYTGSGTVPDSIISEVQTFVGYEIEGKRVRHIGDRNTAGSRDAASATIEIIGSVRAGDGVTSRFEQGSQSRLGESIGDLSDAEAIQALHRNVKNFLGNEDMIRGCGRNYASSDGKIHINGVDWDAFRDCSYQGGRIVFFDGVNVVMEDAIDDIVEIPAIIRTIVIRGGNLEIKSNIVYPPDVASFGAIVIRHDNNGDGNQEGGLIRLYPNVRNIIGAFYTEGGIISVNSDGMPVFMDRARELGNQLFWHGLLISKNTLGGSDITPPRCPADTGCDSLATLIRQYYDRQYNITLSENEALREAARIYDLVYFRSFHAAGSGLRAGYDADGTRNPLLLEPPGGIENNNAFILKYDGRIQTNPPPLFSSGDRATSVEIR